jgi:hypothetical protein
MPVNDPDIEDLARIVCFVEVDRQPVIGMGKGNGGKTY